MKFLMSTLILIGLMPVYTYGNVKGSFEYVSNEPYYTFLSTDTDNTIQGFAEFNEGFALENNLTTCTFNGYFPVSGSVSLNGGSLILQQDLIFRNVATLVNIGDIDGNNHVIDLCQTVTALSAHEAATITNTTIRLGADTVLTGTIIIQGFCTIYGQGRTLNIGSGSIVIDSNATLEIVNVELEQVHDHTIQCADDSAQLILDSVRWVQDADFTFDKGSIVFRDTVGFYGKAYFLYESSQSSFIQHDSRWILHQGMTLSIGRAVSEGNEPVLFEDATSVLQFENSNVIITGFGMGLTKGMLQITGSSDITIVSGDSDDGVVLGTGNVADDFKVFLDAGASLNILSGAITYNNTSFDGFVSASKDSQVTRHPDSVLYVNSDWVQPSYTLKFVGNVPNPIVAPGVVFSFDNTKIILSSLNVEFDTTGIQIDGPAYLLDGNKSIDVNQGSFPFSTVVSGTDNALSGNGSIHGEIVLTDALSTVSIGLLGDVAQDITLNGGSLYLERDLVLKGAARIDGSGSVHLAEQLLYAAPQHTTWTGDILWHAQNSTIEFPSSIDLIGSWTFAGACTINAQGNTIDLSDGGEIVVAEGSHLTIRNARIIGIQQQNIACLAQDSTLTLENVVWVQSDDYAFSQGSFLIKDHVRIMGNDVTFAYQTNQTSTVASVSTLLIDESVTFSYDPLNYEFDEAWQQLLAFEDRTSIMQLDSATLHATAIGLVLKRGQLEILSDSQISIEYMLDEFGDPIDNLGITFGDSTDAAHDMRLKINAGAVFDFTMGSFIWRNLNIGSLRMASETASYIWVGEGTNFLLYEDFSTPHGTAYFYGDNILGRVIGNEFTISLVFYGTVSYVDL